eukprot:342563_1
MSELVMMCVLILAFISIVTATEYSLYAIISGETNDFSSQDIKLIATNFDAMQSTINSTTNKVIHSYKPDFKIVHYHNSAPTTDIIYIENDKTSANRYPFSVLTSSLTSDKSDNIIHLQLIEKTFKSIPIKASTTTNNYSINCDKFVSWIRINNEYMKVTNIEIINTNNHTYKLQVNRAFIGNDTNNFAPNISKHNANELIFAPVYSSQVPGTKGCTQIRYSVNPYGKYGVNMYANYTHTDIENNFDGSWYDCLTSKPAGASDGLGNALSVDTVWDDFNNKYFNCIQYKTAQQNRLTNIFNYLQNEYKINPNNVTIYGNDMFYSAYYNCHTYELLESNPPSFPNPLSGYCIEAYALHETGDCSKSQIEWNDLINWKDNINEFINATSLNLAAMPMIAQAGCKSPAIEKLSQNDYKKVMLFGYGSYLMGVKSTNGNTMFGIPAIVERNNKRYVYVDEIFFYKLGNPKQFEKTIDDYLINKHVSYSRIFDNGIVIVNPTNDTDQNIKLTQQYIDPNTNKTVDQITLYSHTASILLIQ